MQLPRGTFHRLYKSVTLRSLKDELASTQFTGYCSIALGKESAILVFDRGQVLLAECGAEKGQQALDDLRRNEEREAAAELNHLTPEQINLAQEFNRPCSTESPKAGDSGRASRVRSERQRQASSPKPGQGAKPPAPPAAAPHVRPGKATGGSIGASPAQENQEDLNSVMQTIEEMDLEKLNSTFRANCKDMLRRINLEHLIQDGDM